MSGETYRKWGVLTDDELAQRVAGMIDPDGALDDAEARANATCIGDMNRGCY